MGIAESLPMKVRKPAALRSPSANRIRAGLWMANEGLRVMRVSSSYSSSTSNAVCPPPEVMFKSEEGDKRINAPSTSF